MLPMIPTKQVLILFSALCLALVPAAHAFSATTTVQARSSSWGPARTTIERGDRIKWDNSSSGFQAQDHTVKSYGRNWSKNTPLPVGSSTTNRFRATGRFMYRCQLHSFMSDGICEGMCGVIRVVRPS